MIYQKLINDGWQDICFGEYEYLFNSNIKVQAIMVYSQNNPVEAKAVE